jgi:carbamoyl-phosphate synthase large subunit
VRNVCDVLTRVAPRLEGVVVSLGGQTPLKLAHALEAAGIPVLGTSPSSIDLAEDRERFNDLCTRLGIPQPPGSTAATPAAALEAAAAIGYPVLVRPSYVLGGRAMQIVYDDAALESAMREMSAEGSLGREGGLSAERPALIDRFLEDAVEVDVDAVRDQAGEVIIGGIMEHIEEAGVHSGDSACAIPPPTLPAAVIATIEEHTRSLAAALEVCGLLNVQYAVKDGAVLIIEANPRASRTVPFVSKATGVPLAKVAARVMLGATLESLRDEGLLRPPADSGHVSVKEAVLPFDRFPDVDTLLGPEMRSTGEVMGIDRSFGLAFAKSQAAAGNRLPTSGTVFLSLADRDKDAGAGGGAPVRRARVRAGRDRRHRPRARVRGPARLRRGGQAGAGVGQRRSRRGGADLVGQGRPGREHAARSWSSGRRRPHPPRRDAPPRRVHHHDRRGRAAVAGIAQRAEHEPVVRSLQDYHRDDQLRLEV